MRVSTQVQVTDKEIRDAVIAVAREASGVKDAGSASVRFICDSPSGATESVNLSAVVEFVKVGH